VNTRFELYEDMYDGLKQLRRTLGKLLPGKKSINTRTSKGFRLYMKFSRYPSGGDLLAVESFELLITGLTSGEPILGDMVIDEGGDMTLLSS
jgi:hypothetical protein